MCDSEGRVYFPTVVVLLWNLNQPPPKMKRAKRRHVLYLSYSLRPANMTVRLGLLQFLICMALKRHFLVITLNERKIFSKFMSASLGI
jgi:hypothetical protein